MKPCLLIRISGTPAYDSMLESLGDFELFELTIIPDQNVPGPELYRESLKRFKIAVPAGWDKLREKSLATLRRTVAVAALEVGKQVKPAFILVTDIDLCGLAGVLVSRSLNCPMLIQLDSIDIHMYLFDERKSSLLDACIQAADVIIVADSKAEEILAGFYQLDRDKIYNLQNAVKEQSNLRAMLQKSKLNTRVPWDRPQNNKRFRVSKPMIHGNELRYIENVLQSGWWGYGPACKYLERRFEETYGQGAHAIALSSCTAALNVALRATGIKPGDEVIVPALSFASTAMAVLQLGGVVRFADVDKDTLMLSTKSVEEQLSQKTRAVIVVDFAGVPFDIQALQKVIGDKSVAIIDDAAHALGAKRNKMPVGMGSSFICFSLAATKQVTSGSGGILVYFDNSLVRFIREYSDIGLRLNTLERQLFPTAPSNEVVEIGFRFRLNDILAAIAIAQLERIHSIMKHRSLLVARYYQNLSSVDGCELIQVPVDCIPSWYIMPVRVPESVRDTVRSLMAQQGIDTSVHYPSLMDQPVFRSMPGSAPTASQESRKLISLPLYNDLSEDDVDIICQKFIESLQKSLL